LYDAFIGVLDGGVRGKLLLLGARSQYQELKSRRMDNKGVGGLVVEAWTWLPVLVIGKYKYQTKASLEEGAINQREDPLDTVPVRHPQDL